METDTILTSIIALSGGEIVGRVRLQKMVFLLQSCCLSTKIPFRYHHYGPYSRAVDDAIDKAKAKGDVIEKFKNRTGDGAEYSIFKYSGEVDISIKECEGKLRPLVALMKERPSTELEIAATIYWLRVFENNENWSEELRVRKGNKITPSREEQALRILEACELRIS